MAAEQAKAETQPEQPTMPYAEVTGTEVHIPVYRGVVQVVAASLDGGTEVIETIECGCKWAHTTPEIAIRCGRKLAAGRGLRIGAPEA
jgi:hypothetical protein